MSVHYYLASPASDQLAGQADRVLENFRTGDPSPQEPHFEKLVDYLVPELLDGYLIKTCDAVGVGPTASKVVHGAVDTISRTVSTLVSHMLKKRSNKELEPLTGYVEDVYLRANSCSSGMNMVGCEIDQHLYERMMFVTNEVKAGRSQQVLAELHELMLVVVDVVLEGMMKRPIGLMKMNFVVRKIADGATATCRGAGHLVVNRVFKKLDDEQLLRLAHYFGDLIVTAER